MKILLILTAICYIHSCSKGQKPIEIEETSISIPYSLKQDTTEYVSVRDADIPVGAVGKSVIDVYIDKTGRITGSNVIYLKIKNQDSILLDYYDYKLEIVTLVDYPEQIRKIVTQLKKYAESLTVIKLHNDDTKLNSFRVRVPRNIRIE